MSVSRNVSPPSTDTLVAVVPVVCRSPKSSRNVPRRSVSPNPSTLFRIGLGGRTELRIGHAGIVGGKGSHGAGDSELGAKVNLIAHADGWRPELAILGGLSLPTGDDGLSSDGVDPSFLVSFAHELSPRMSLGYNVGAAWESSALDLFDKKTLLSFFLFVDRKIAMHQGSVEFVE